MLDESRLRWVQSASFAMVLSCFRWRRLLLTWCVRYRMVRPCVRLRESFVKVSIWSLRLVVTSTSSRDLMIEWISFLVLSIRPLSLSARALTRWSVSYFLL